METLLEKHWHHLEGSEAARFLDADPARGLDEFEVERRFQRFGENLISGKKGRTALSRFMLQFHQPLVYILIVAGVVTAILGEWIDSGVIFGVVLVNAVVGHIQESKAVRALDALASSLSAEALVLRAGKAVRVPAAQVVPGDVVLLRTGDKVPADLRLLSDRELRVDESMLTGESLPVDKDAAPLPRDTVLAERRNMAYAGTLVSSGQGAGVVVATGNRTEIGRISELIDAADELETPLTRKISRFSHVLLASILILAAASFVLGVLRDEPASEMFMAAVALAVGAIPEGLPAAVTIILAMGVSRMAGRKAIIRRLPAVETLGGTTVICSDKTGTLTENQMTVQEIFAGGASYAVSGLGYAPEGAVEPVKGGGAPDAALVECLRAGALCNDSRIRLRDGRHQVEGDPTEGALLVSAGKYGLDAGREQEEYARVDVLPFESRWRYMATLHTLPGGKVGRVACLKGAVERVLDCCKSAMLPSGEVGGLDVAAVIEAQHAMAAKGLRVLAFASKELPEDARLERSESCMGMVFLGLQGMIDPPREEARTAIAACLRAGIKVKMITGDHARTAEAIGMRLGLRGGDCLAGEDCPVMTGREIAELSDAELTRQVPGIPVFARVSPEQKLRLVMALQRNGEICAMTGDGVNDAPALKQADIGVAMGITGTEVAKEAADMVLTDDNFATITAAVEEGRGVFANLLKFIAWTLPTNAGEGLVILAAVLFGVALPILPVQILWINMTTAGCLGLMLAFEPMEPGIMDRPPRRPERPMLDRIILRRIGIVSLLLLVSAFGLFKWELAFGASMEAARTVAVNVFVMVEAFYLLNARSFTRSPFALGLATNKWVLGGFWTMAALQLFYTYAPVMHRLFSSAPLGPWQWLRIVGCGLGVYFLVELDKKLSASDI
ncbi:cation-transporting P-type ATPase [Desulfovibrio sp. Fe33]|uniref:cation-transporting P-type ATPase n=1 Tax=Desulfovibrio sp. Fe33 TaxID=3020842 RepID=UPI00234C43B6|nr:cation-transporting P-type ATPase [Desulfovibrio sp. Fe33]